MVVSYRKAQKAMCLLTQSLNKLPGPSVIGWRMSLHLLFWEDTGVPHSHDAWTPEPASQTLGFTQTRDYQHTQERFEQKQTCETPTTQLLLMHRCCPSGGLDAFLIMRTQF